MILAEQVITVPKKIGVKSNIFFKSSSLSSWIKINFVDSIKVNSEERIIVPIFQKSSHFLYFSYFSSRILLL